MWNLRFVHSRKFYFKTLLFFGGITYRLKKAFKDAKTTQKDLYPALTLGTTIYSSSEKINTIFNVPFTAGLVTLKFPLLEWNKIKWNIKIAEEEYSKVKLDFEDKVIIALNEVSNSILQYKIAFDAFKNLEKKHEHDVKISNYYKIKYYYGKSELSFWLTALNTETESQLAMLQSRYQTLKNENIIFKTLAGQYSVVKK